MADEKYEALLEHIGEVFVIPEVAAMRLKLETGVTPKTIAGILVGGCNNPAIAERLILCFASESAMGHGGPLTQIDVGARTCQTLGNQFVRWFNANRLTLKEKFSS